MKTAFNIFYYVFLLLILVIFSSFFISPFFSKFPRPYFFIVQSGSMEPELKLGSAIVIWPKSNRIVSPIDFAPKFQKDEIISFRQGKETFTHRIVGVEQNQGKIFYQTKGDANPAADIEKVPEENVIGKVVFSLPYFGYFIAFVKTKTGYITLIIIPATIIVYTELLKIKDELRRMIFKRRLFQA